MYRFSSAYPSPSDSNDEHNIARHCFTFLLNRHDGINFGIVQSVPRIYNIKRDSEPFKGSSC